MLNEKFIQSKKTIFLDRDGVISKRPPRGEYIKSWNDFEFLPGAVEALKILSQEGYRIFFISNQAGIGRGIMKEEDLNLIYSKLKEELQNNGIEIAGFYYCPHEMNEDCDCRKPKPGLLLKAAKDYNINLRKSVFIGDEERDLLAGNAAGCKTILVTFERNLLQIVKFLITA